MTETILYGMSYMCGGGVKPTQGAFVPCCGLRNNLHDFPMALAVSTIHMDISVQQYEQVKLKNPPNHHANSNATADTPTTFNPVAGVRGIDLHPRHPRHRPACRLLRMGSVLTLHAVHVYLRV